MTKYDRSLTVAFLLGGSIVAAVSAQEAPNLVANLRVADSESAHPGSFAAINSNLSIFVSRPSSNSDEQELWRTDSTADGTHLLAALPASDQPYSVFVNQQRGILYSSKQSGLWSTDGTLEHTVELVAADIDTVHHDIHRDRLFAITEPVSGQAQRLYSTDGTTEGTVIVDGPFTETGHEYNIHSTSSTTWIAIGGSENQLWRTDGTTEGTVLVLSDLHLTPIVGTSEQVVFTRTRNSELEFWRTDGTSDGTEMIERPDPQRRIDLYGPIVATADRMFFVAGGITINAGVYHLDPRSGPMTRIASFDSGISKQDIYNQTEAFRSWSQSFVLDDVLYFTPRNIAMGSELWRSDGTVDGTWLVTDLCPGPCGSRAYLSEAVNLDGELFLAIDEQSGLGSRVWRTDGNSATTRVDPSFDMPACPTDRPSFARFDQRLLVALQDDLWVTDGTANGVQRLAQGRHLIGDTASLSDGLLFGGSDGLHGFEPWITDGTPSGTGMIKDLAFREGGSEPRLMTVVPGADHAFFAATVDDLVGEEMWSVSPSGEVAPLATAPVCHRSMEVLWTTPAAGKLFYATSHDDGEGVTGVLWAANADGTNVRQLGTFGATGLRRAPGLPFGNGIVFATGGGHWISDGTVGGTRLLTPDSMVFRRHQVVLGDLIFLRQSPVGSGPLWVSDGTPEGTRALSNSEGEPAIVERGPLIPFNGHLYFDRSRTDGTDAGTVTIPGINHLMFPKVATQDHIYYLDQSYRELFVLTADETIVALAPFNIDADLATTDHAVFFRNNDTVWASLGTPITTRPLLPQPFRFVSTLATNLGDRLLFHDHNFNDKRGLWISDGTPMGTSLLTPDVRPFFYRGTATTEGVFFFQATREDEGSELWRSNGTAAGTFLVADIEPGPDSSAPGELAIAGPNLYFAATTQPYGREPWTFSVAGLLPEPLHLGNANRFEATVRWTKPNGERGAGRPVRLTDDTGYFWFFNDSNVELMVKVLDGRNNNGHFWVFYGSLSNVAYTLEVRDTVTGAVKIYDNPQQHFGSVGDTQAFPAEPDPVSANAFNDRFLVRSFDTRVPIGTKGVGTCANTTDALCLQQHRFRVEVTWQDNDGTEQAGTAVPLSADTGTFWFGNEANVELIVKVLDGRNNNDHFWVFYGALSNLAYTLTVTDTETGAVQVYDNPRGTFASRGDTQAFSGLQR